MSEYLEPPALIALDWGTSSLRAYLMDARGGILDRAQSPMGIMKVGAAGFAAAFDAIAGTWRDRWPDLPAVAAGMVGSTQGWVEAPYVRCPAELGNLAVLTEVPERNLHIVPGLMLGGEEAPDVMRGEETQIVGALSLRPELTGHARMVLPGTHSKWARIASARIETFATYMTGEVFAVLRDHSILGRFAREGAPAPDAAEAREAFLRGLDAARSEEGIAALLFSARSLVLTGALSPGASLDYLSGLLIGEELRSALDDPTEPLVLIGDPALSVRYRIALDRFGVLNVVEIEDAAATGLWCLAVAAGLVDQYVGEKI